VSEDRKTATARTVRRPSNGKRKIRILVVEDDIDLGAAVCELLNESDYDASHAIDGVDALERLSAGDLPALILLDLMMPRMDGWKFREEQMRDSRLRDIPVVVLSAVGEIVEAIDALHILRKPVSAAMLLDAVARFSQRSRKT
jgi:two-component system, chemotaxis family, chemotaxis protein CheY